jgi:starvation-inducible outer membrane lipoprotein
VKSQLPATALAFCCLLMLGGCATIPKDALTLSPDSLERRQLQTRRIDAISEKDLLSAAAGVLQDLGFNIDESETRLGLIVASKDRSAVTGTQVAGAVVAALLGVYTAIDKTQKIRVSLVTRPVISDGVPVGDSHYLRITIQRLVWNTNGQISRTESIEEPDIYQAFFERLSKSIFLEVQEI